MHPTSEAALPSSFYEISLRSPIIEMFFFITFYSQNLHAAPASGDYLLLFVRKIFSLRNMAKKHAILRKTLFLILVIKLLFYADI